MQKFLVRRTDRGKRAPQFHAVGFDKKIRTKPHATLHRFHFAGIRFPIAMFKEPAFVVALQNRGGLIKCFKGVFDAVLPFGMWQISAQRNPATAPAER